jgi:ribosomal protein S18 acetylase RimI-like enzyme
LRRHHGQVAPHLGELWPEEESWAKRRAFYETLLEDEDAIVLVARVDGEAAGHAVATIDAASATWRHPEQICWVHDLVVLSEYRGRGIGEALVERLWEESGVEEMRLACVETNDDAMAFYNKLGFERGPIVDLVSRRTARRAP